MAREASTTRLRSPHQHTASRLLPTHCPPHLVYESHYCKTQILPLVSTVCNRTGKDQERLQGWAKDGAALQKQQDTNGARTEVIRCKDNPWPKMCSNQQLPGCISTQLLGSTLKTPNWDETWAPKHLWMIGLRCFWHCSGLHRITWSHRPAVLPGQSWAPFRACRVTFLSENKAGNFRF